MTLAVHSVLRSYKKKKKMSKLDLSKSKILPFQKSPATNIKEHSRRSYICSDINMRIYLQMLDYVLTQSDFYSPVIEGLLNICKTLSLISRKQMTNHKQAGSIVSRLLKNYNPIIKRQIIQDQKWEMDSIGFLCLAVYP